jgi:hypothetical protein
MKGHIKRFNKYYKRFESEPSEYNKKMLAKEISNLLTQFAYKHNIDIPEIVEYKIKFGDLLVPINIIYKDLELNAPEELFWDYVDLCLEGKKLDYEKLIKK